MTRPGFVSAIVCCETARAMPKSESLTTSSLVTRMFAGLMSRCKQPGAMRVGKAVADLRRVVDRDRFGNGAVGDDLGERGSVDEFHHDVVRLAFAADVVGVDDVGVRQARRRFGFLVETAHEFVVGGVLRRKTLIATRRRRTVSVPQ